MGLLNDIGQNLSRITSGQSTFASLFNGGKDLTMSQIPGGFRPEQTPVQTPAPTQGSPYGPAKPFTTLNGVNYDQTGKAIGNVATGTNGTNATFYKPDPNSQTVYNSQGQALDYNTYLAQGGKSDFSNVTSGPVPQSTSSIPNQSSGIPYQASSQSTQSAGSQSLGGQDGINTPTPDINTPSTSLTNDTGYSDIQKLLADNIKYQDGFFANLAANSQVGPDEQAQQSKVASDEAGMQALGYQANGLYNPGNQTIALPFLTGQAKNQMVGAGIQSTLDEAKLNYMQGNRQFAFNSASTLLDQSRNNLTSTLDNYLKLAPQNVGTNYNPTTGALNAITRNPFTGEIQNSLVANIGPQKSLTPSGSPILDPTSGDYVQQFIQNGSTPVNMYITGPNAGQVQSTGAGFSLQGGGSTGSLVSQNPNPNAVISTSSGASYDMTSYASGNAVGGPASQAANITNTLAKLPQITDASTATSAIQSLKKGSPINGNMVMQASQQYGVDPGMIIATMQAETQLGTDGSKGSKENNFGNVGNTDSLMASGGSKGFATPQDGVNAVAENLAHRQIKATPGQSTTPSIPKYQDLYNAAPPTLRPALKAAPDGSSYIDQSELKTDPLQTQAQILSSKYNVPIKNPGEVSDIQGLQTALSNLSSVATKFAEIASPTAVGAVTHNLTDPFSSFFGTSYGNDVKAYQDNQEQIFQQVKTLATGSPRLSEQGLSLAKTALPQWSEFSHDDLAQGQLKIASTQRLLDNAIRTYLPNYKGSIINMNGQYLINDPQTNTPHLFPTYSAAQQAQQQLSVTPQ